MKKKPGSRLYRRALARLLQSLADALGNEINSRQADWIDVEANAEDALHWADILAASSLRWRANQQSTRFEETDLAWMTVVRRNKWLVPHVRRMDVTIKEEAESFTQGTQRYFDKTVKSFRKGTLGPPPPDHTHSLLDQFVDNPYVKLQREVAERMAKGRTKRFVVRKGGKGGVIAPEQSLMTPTLIKKTDQQLIHLSEVPDYALKRFERDSVGTIKNDSDQVTLSDPLVGAQFQIAEYFTRDDRRVRPTHAAMQGFVAARGWDGWPKCRPLNGWNCRCGCRFLTNKEAEKLGYIGSDGKPRFEKRWPNTAARLNYESGKFPDPGPFAQPKLWAV